MRSVERLDYTGYSAEVLVCSLKDQTVKVEADVPEWIDSNAAFYITYSHLDYLGLLWEEIRKELVNKTSEGWKVGDFEFREPDLKKVTYSKGTFTYADQLKKGQCTVFSFKGVFKALPEGIYLRNGKRIPLPKASLTGQSDWLFFAQIPEGYKGWNASLMIPERLGRDSEFEKAYRNHLKSLFELVDKRLITEEELGHIEIPEEPVPPEDYCAEFTANGSKASSTRLLGSSGLYSDGNYYLFEYSGKNAETIFVSFTSTGCRPAVWFTFVGTLGGSGESIKENGHMRSIFGVFSNFSVHNGDGDGPLFVDSSGHVILDLVVEP
ncbi:hypothetical protein [Thermococcus waiotapuensis]|uniref:Uncharacterized protein n=1 Tax=Thermococcus waiotapuensis TaxID=90909 RepID=A0AAE4T4A3_9EURY|nr:hypothetical protein [Thermococcus waiotapuensis]MDV3104571.1 hypothetical protein [Thermococcus waiotapuensis]